MSAVAVDTSVVLAILKGEQKGELWLDCLQSAAETASLVLSSVAYAEVRSFFASDGACQAALIDMDMQHSPLTEESSLLAGKIFRAYRRAGGLRKTILADFLIAAHAATQAHSLATEDRGYMRSYFPSIRLLVPLPR